MTANACRGRIVTQRQPQARENYHHIVRTVGRRLRLPAVVALELRAGVRSVEQRRALDNLVGAFERRDRVLVPTLSAFLEAGRVLSDLAVREQFTHGPGTRSLLNDALIATTCREAQVTLATDNHDHFSRIRRHLRGFRFVAPDSIV